MRLIDADKLIDHLEKVKNESASLVDMAHIIGFQSVIDAQPTAYDVDKVVEQLEDRKSLMLETLKISEADIDRGRIYGMDKAIEIVKGECATEQSCEWKLEDLESNLYVTGCENRQLIFEGTPEENGYKYCPYCGRKIKRGGADGD